MSADSDNCYRYSTYKESDSNKPNCDTCYAGYYLNTETKTCELVFARPF